MNCTYSPATQLQFFYLTQIIHKLTHEFFMNYFILTIRLMMIDVESYSQIITVLNVNLTVNLTVNLLHIIDVESQNHVMCQPIFSIRQAYCFRKRQRCREWRT